MVKDVLIYKEYDYCRDKIKNWYYNGNERFLTIETIPFNLNIIFRDIILSITKDKGKVLYISGLAKAEVIEDLSITDKSTNDQIIKGNLAILLYSELYNIADKYDLIICDDISTFSKVSKDNLRCLLPKLEKLSDKIILYTPENIIRRGEKIEVTCIYHRIPFVEPRIMTTRIDLNKDIPNLLYEYILWFIDKNQKIIIYVPTNEKLETVYNYYKTKLKIDNKMLYRISKKDDKTIINNVLKQKEMAIIITDNIEANLKTSGNLNAIVLFADNYRYTYKQFLYLCGEFGRINKELPEFILVARTVSCEMERVKSITSSYNKRKWERKSIDY